MKNEGQIGRIETSAEQDCFIKTQIFAQTKLLVAYRYNLMTQWSYNSRFPTNMRSMSSSPRRRRRHRFWHRRQILRQIPNPLLQTGTRLIRLRRHTNRILRTTRDMKIIIDLLQQPTITESNRSIPPQPGNVPDVRSICTAVCILVVEGTQSRYSKELVAIQRAK